tara:strand:+ start:5601 stop:5945 length:345 start_codon:yes stop_codon:yes gene_type:complete
MKLSCWKLSFSCISFFLIPVEVYGGLGTFTYLDKVETWIIERKIDSSNGDVLCRASVPENGTWFSARPRLDKNDALRIPKSFSSKRFKDEKILVRVKSALELCRSGLIYIPQEK